MHTYIHVCLRPHKRTYAWSRYGVYAGLVQVLLQGQSSIYNVLMLLIQAFFMLMLLVPAARVTLACDHVRERLLAMQVLEKTVPRAMFHLADFEIRSVA